jgi:hypothetical protein
VLRGARRNFPDYFGNGFDGSCVKSGKLGILPLSRRGKRRPVFRFGGFEKEKGRGKVPSKLPAFLAAPRRWPQLSACLCQPLDASCPNIGRSQHASTRSLLASREARREFPHNRSKRAFAGVVARDGNKRWGCNGAAVASGTPQLRRMRRPPRWKVARGTCPAVPEAAS